MPVLLLLFSIALSTVRNLLSKNLSTIAFRTKGFFQFQSVLFSSGAIALLMFGTTSMHLPSIETLTYAVIYAVLLLLAQWLYTAALGSGNTSLCSTVYSMGFIIPTVSGAIFWSEDFGLSDLLGVLCAVAAVICSGYSSGNGSKKNNRYFLPLLIAMLSSGGLGIMQKVQQKSAFPEQKNVFLLVAFLLAAILSFISSLNVSKNSVSTPSKKTLAVASLTGIAFGCCNLLNTALSGLLPSAIFFPTLNIGVILLTTLCSILFFNECLRRKNIPVLILGCSSILLLNLL